MQLVHTWELNIGEAFGCVLIAELIQRRSRFELFANLFSFSLRFSVIYDVIRIS